ncbi:MAG TPA: isoprenylcysteine carboxylmethyltransferase family protein [Anaerolineales bacterium]|nr:isoprenylcysteine carboxylmethyltransferase family protein [Anaerolineales bacterium]
MITPVFRILFTLAFLSCLFIAGSYRRKAQAGEKFDTSQEGWLYLPLRLGGLALWGYCFLYMIYPQALTWSFFTLPDGVRWAGGAVALFVCMPLLVWAQNSLGNNVSTTVITRQEHQLITHGPYRWIRNPLYSIATLYFVSLALVAASWFLLAAIALALVLLTLRLPKEEAGLIARFGDEYREYMKRTGRYLPRLGG